MYIPPTPTPSKKVDVYFANWDGKRISLKTLRDELTWACGNGAKPKLETLQEARDIIERLLDAGLPADDGEHTNASVELVTYRK